MAFRAEQLLNDITTTLNGAINDSVTTATLTDGSGYPLDGDYRLMLSKMEIVKVTSRTGNVVTMERGVDGSPPLPHGNGCEVVAVITQEGIDQYVRDFIEPAAFDRPPHRLLNKTGVTLTKSDFTEVNFGTSSSIDDPAGGITIAMQPGTNPQQRLLLKSAPATPYTVTAHMLLGPGQTNSTENIANLVFRETSSGKLSLLGFRPGDNTFVFYLDTPTSVGTAPSSISIDCPHRHDAWLRLEADGTNLKFSISYDGFNFFEVKSDLNAFHFDSAPNEIGWGGDNQGADGESVHLLSWAEE